MRSTPTDPIRRARLAPSLLLLLLGPAAAAAQAGGGGEAPDRPPLYDDLGDHAWSITTDVPEAQAYFDQGLRLYYAFNHQEAVRSFREAQRLDPECAMCWWGEALAWGPNINLPMDSASGVAAWEALQEAEDRRMHAAPEERALIDALGGRYAEVPPADRAALDSAWASSLVEIRSRWPEDPEIAVLMGEAQMDLRPWDYWREDGTPHPGIDGALAAFREVLEENPDHPGACHFYIHAVEKLHPGRAVPCAERLAGLMPGAGHIVHMPGHIYIRVGRYRDAIRLNEHAAHADETYIRDQQPRPGVYTAGYYPHNYDFLAFAASMVKEEEKAVEAADRLASLIPREMLPAPGMTFLQHYLTRPLQMRVRFGRWDEILETPAPSEEHPHARGMWHYARGRALAATGRVDEAEAELRSLHRLEDVMRGTRLEFNDAGHVLEIAGAVLAGRIAEARGEAGAAVARLREAVELEDALFYGKPPEWSVPVRQELGAVLLAAGRPDEAAVAFREDLERFPANAWSEDGLARAEAAAAARR
jgi:tetratricopeptide (TPR) repeat protein